MNTPEPSSNDLAVQRTHLASDRTNVAVVRTQLAYERTLLAWVRTAVSLISFGFTIYKAFQYIRGDDAVSAHEHLLEPRGVALVMIGLGVCALVLADFEYRRSMQRLRRTYPNAVSDHRPFIIVVTWVLALLGVTGLVLVYFRQ
jgi:uncharacterized membrane protein YidH (DUF202 family)